MKVALHGNCQTGALRTMILEVQPTWEVAMFEVHQLQPGASFERYVDGIRTADAILTQPVADGYRDWPELASSWVRENAKPGAAVIGFPNAYFQGYHPTSFFLNGAKTDLVNNQWFQHFGDAVAVKGILDGRPASAIAQTLLAEDFLPSHALYDNVDRSLAELRRREAADALPIRVASYVENNWQRAQLFHIVNHPARSVVAHVVNQFFALMGLGTRAVSDGIDHWHDQHFPSLPCVRRLHSSPRTMADRTASGHSIFVYRDNRLPADRYYEAAIARLQQYDVEDLEAAYRKVQPQLALLGL